MEQVWEKAGLSLVCDSFLVFNMVPVCTECFVSLVGIIFQNYLEGRKKALWLSVSNDLKFDAIRCVAVRVQLSVYEWLLLIYYSTAEIAQ